MGTQNGSKLEIWPWGSLIHVLELKLRPFKVFPCLYREAMRLQCFPPTNFVRGGASCAHKRDDLYQLLTKLKLRLPACIVLFHYAPSSIIWWFLDNFFFCLVFRSPCYTLSKKKQNIIIRGGTGNAWGCNFYTGTQNGSEYEIWWHGNLIHTLELKLWHFKVFPCLYREAMRLQCFRPRATWGAGLRAHINVTTFTSFFAKN